MADLSPAAQAVKDHFLANVPIGLEQGLAAALRVAADQVERKWRGFAHEACQEIRAIADELDNNSTHK